jgi:predicted ArsR family transcriptional regulator
MSPKQEKILVYLKSHPQARYEDIGKEIGTNSSGVVAHHVKSLMAIGKLKRVQKWIVCK